MISAMGRKRNAAATIRTAFKSAVAEVLIALIAIGAFLVSAVESDELIGHSITLSLSCGGLQGLILLHYSLLLADGPSP